MYIYIIMINLYCRATSWPWDWMHTMVRVPSNFGHQRGFAVLPHPCHFQTLRWSITHGLLFFFITLKRKVE